MERSAVHTFLQKCSPTLRIFGVFNAKKPEKSAMFAEKAVQESKPNEACERRIAKRGLIAMLTQTKRWGLDSKGKGRNRNRPFPLVAPLVPFRRCGKERKKETKIYKNFRLPQTLI